MSDETEQAAALLKAEGWTVKEPPPPLPEQHCAKCGVAESDTDFEHLVDFTVEVHNGEEGASYVTRYFCDDCMPDVAKALMALGFESHHHGSTTFLSNEDNPPCGGYGVCKLYEKFDGMREEY